MGSPLRTIVAAARRGVARLRLPEVVPLTADHTTHHAVMWTSFVDYPYPIAHQSACRTGCTILFLREPWHPSFIKN